MTYTENLNLLLYESNDVMNTVDFVNTNNQKIDSYASTTRGIAQSANALAGQANEGVGAADTKIEAINTRLQQDEVDTLPQYKTDTDARLETLEDDVNSFLTPQANWTDIAGNELQSVFDFGGLTIFSQFNTVGVSPSANPLPVKNFNGTISSAAFKGDMLKRAGNPYNIQELNTIFNFPVEMTKNDGSVNITVAGIYYNGVDTIVALLGSNSASFESTWRLLCTAVAFGNIKYTP